MILFLDFDGVLHPERAVMGCHGPELDGEGSLFMWAEPLADLLGVVSENGKNSTLRRATAFT